MKTIELTCKKCNGTMEVQEDDEKIVCPFCGATNWIMESDEIRRDKAKYRYLKEQEIAKAESAVKRDAARYKFLKFKYIFISTAVIAAIVFLIVIINNAKEHAHITPPASASKLLGRQYDVVEHMFEDAGFLNVSTDAVPDQRNAKQDVGKVVSVSIGGKDNFVVDEGFIFHHTDTFDKNDNVRIAYKTIPEPTRSPEDIAADAAVNVDWTEKPIILSAHETGRDQFTVTWEGKAPVYIVMVDGMEKTVVADTKATFKLDNGLHTIQIIPINRDAKRDDIQNVTGPITIKTNVNFLDMYHMKRDRLVAGLFSEEIVMNYSAEYVYDATPMNLKASMDLHGAIHLSFTDSIGADAYLVSYKTGNNEYSVTYDKSDEVSSKRITTDGDSVLIIIDSEYLLSKNCPVIQPDNDYSFSAILQKKPIDYASERTINTLLSSRKSSIILKTTPVWKNPPIISFCDQTADDEITIKWSHPAVELGCQYVVSLRNKAVFITTGESELIRVVGSEAVIKNLQNGSYTLVVTPENDGSKGTSSSEFTVVVNNNWSQAPEVVLTQVDSRTAKVDITHIYGIESYNIKVSCGNTANILSFVDLDYGLYGEYTVDAVSPVTEYTFAYENEANPTDGIKVKFEIYGIHKSEDGTVQNSATTVQQITLRP